MNLFKYIMYIPLLTLNIMSNITTTTYACFHNNRSDYKCLNKYKYYECRDCKSDLSSNLSYNISNYIMTCCQNNTLFKLCRNNKKYINKKK